MAQRDPRVERYAGADVDFTTLPEPIALADTLVEEPVSSCPSGGGWDGGAASDGAD